MFKKIITPILFLFLFLFFSKATFAQSVSPTPTSSTTTNSPRPVVVGLTLQDNTFVCNCSTGLYEWHTYRPAPKCPCTDSSEKASLCGNSVYLPIKYEGSQTKESLNALTAAGICTKNGNNYSCNHPIVGSISRTLDLSQAEMPILGNTEDTKNLDAAKKVNNYVGWYLNGIGANKEDYSGENKLNMNDFVNFAGPLNKLVSWDLQIGLKDKTTQGAGSSQHNQVVYDGYKVSSWKNNLPPIRQEGQSFFDWWKKLQEWYGYRCPEIAGVVLCFKPPEIIDWFDFTNNQNELSKYWNMVPLSSREDQTGLIKAEDPQITSSDGWNFTKTEFTSIPQKSYVAHTEEDTQLAEALQLTFAYQGADLTGSAGGISQPKENQNVSACKLINTRSNPGDNLMLNNLSMKLDYAGTVECNYSVVDSRYDTSDLTPREYTCKKETSFEVKITTQTPHANDLWSKLVAGPAGIVKRIFPKTDPESSGITSFLDIPASTTSDGEQLYFPHIGGVSEYFLKGIQTMLRPRGYGESIEFGDPDDAMCKGKPTEPTLKPAQGACQLASSIKIGSVTLPNNFLAMVETAAETFKVPPSLILGVMYGEGVFNPGRFDWTEENVKKWSLNCAAMPSCNPNYFSSSGGGILNYFEQYWTPKAKKLKEMFPDRDPNPCNLYDSVMVLGMQLQGGAMGGSMLQNKTCFGIPLNTGRSQQTAGSCSWSNSDVETAIHAWETGYLTDCFTKVGGCATGGMSAKCPSGDSCETLSKCSGGSCSSHNYCVWNVYSKNK